MDLMLATKYTEKAAQKLLDMNKVLYVQEKYDGARVYVMNGRVFTRNNKELLLPDCDFKKQLQELPESFCFDGELLLINNEQVLDRKTGNGIINKALHGNCSLEEANKFYLKIFDITNLSEVIKSIKEPYWYRLDYIGDIVGYCADAYSVTNTGIVHNVAEIDAYFREYVSEGKEGIMLKSPYNLYKGKRVPDILKRKQELTADLRVVGYEKGTGKYEGMLGALICATDDGKLLVNVGTGFTDEQRDFNNAPDIDSIVEVKYNAVIGKKDSDVKSLFLPVYVGLRTDKTTTNTLEEL